MFTDEQKKRIKSSGVRIIGITAISANNMIGNRGGLAIQNKEDMHHFKLVTMGQPVVMGITTFTSCKRPLTGRFPMVLTKFTNASFKDALTFNDLEDLTNQLVHMSTVYIAGGAQIYKIFDGLYTRFLVTKYDQDAEGDTEFPLTFDDGHWSRVILRDITGGTIFSYYYFD